MRVFILCGIYLFLSFNLNAGEVVKTISFSKSDLSFLRIRSYDLVALRGCGWTDEVGNPLLPRKLVDIFLPSGMKVTKVEVEGLKSEPLEGRYNILPAQPPRPLIRGEKFELIEGNPKIYEDSMPYPLKRAEFAHQGYLGGIGVGQVFIYPLEYIPNEGRLIFHREITIRIHYKAGFRSPKARLSPLFLENIKKRIINPEDLERVPFISFPSEYREVIITQEKYRSGFQPLCDWHTKKGVRDTIVSLEDILLNFSGRDPQEKIRSFIQYAQENWGIEFVLLGGDTDVIPDRECYIFTTDQGFMPDEDTIPCDLYYSDLDGDWDGNGNGVFGEFTDDVDMYPDVFVGRAPVNNSDEVKAFVDKVLKYEREPDVSYLKKELLPAEILWTDPLYTGEEVNNSIASLTPPGFQIAKLYEYTYENLSANAVLDSLESGYNLIHQATHGNPWALSCADGVINNPKADALENKDRIGIYISIACLVGAMDYNCIVEHFMNNSNGGTVAWIGNSRFGWGTPPGMGPSEALDLSFFNALFADSIYKIGMALATAKFLHIGEARWSGVARWCIYELNLFGEPEMGIWTDIPTQLDVSFPAVVSLGPQEFKVEVKHNSNPVKGALVCVRKGDEVYEYGETGDDGIALLSINPSTVGTMEVTVTAQNCLPYEDSCRVSTGPDIEVIPDTIVFDYSLHPVKGGRDIKNPIPVKGKILSSVVAEGLDTLQHPYEGPFFIFPEEWQVEYEATALIPTQLCSLKHIQVAFSNTGVDPATKTCSLFVWKNDKGSPGERDLSLEFQVSLDAGASEWIDFDISSLGLVYSDTFWIGHYENTPGDLSSMVDFTPSWGDKFSADGSVWYDDNYDYLQRALVKHFGLLPSKMWVCNRGNQVLKVWNIIATPHWITSLSLYNFQVEPRDSVGIKISVDTTGLADGKYFTNLLISSNDPDERVYLEPVKLLKGVWPEISVKPETLRCLYVRSFDSIPTQPLIDTLWVINRGGKELRVSKITTQNNWIVKIEPQACTLEAYDSTEILVYIDPRILNEGDYLGVIKFLSNDSYNNPYYEWVMLGVDILKPDMRVKPDTLVIDAEESLKGNLWISNFGDGELRIDSINTQTLWIIDAEPTNFSLSPKDSLRVEVTCDTSIMGGLTGYGILSIFSNDPDDKKFPYPVRLKKKEGIYDRGLVPKSFALSIPSNPSYPPLTLHYQIPVKTEVSLMIYDIGGKLVRTLVNGVEEPGFRRVRWDGRDERGKSVPSGVYFCCFASKGYRKIRKLVLIKQE